MKKNININIGGIIFHLEEDGFEKLKNYLDSVNTYFSSFEDSKEIIEDIEGRIAEIFLGKLEGNKQIISLEDIDELIITMGTTKDFDASLEADSGEANESSQNIGDIPDAEEKSEDKTYEKVKRLYRDNKRRIIGGVASGLANYFGVDSIWVRLILLALLFNIFFWGLSGFVFIAYIVLWIAIPDSNDLEEDTKLKKLYRNVDDKVLGGVASGISSYFGIDPVAIRVFFVISIFLGGAGFLVYIILWIITPEAKTITEKMQMQGEAVTLSGIEKSIKNSFNQKGRDSENAFVKILLFPFRLIAMIFGALSELLGPLFRFMVEAIRVLAGLFLVFLGSTLMLAFTLILGVLLGVGEAFESYINLNDYPVEALFDSLGTTATIFSYLASMIPALSIALIGLVIILRRQVVSTYVAWSLFGLWLIGTIGVAVTVPRLVSDFLTDSSYLEEKTFFVEKSTPTLYLNNLDIRSYRSVELKLRGHLDSGLYNLKMDFNSRGYSKSKAKANAEAVNYGVKKENGNFYFDSDLTFGGVPFRFQRVEATFYIPFGKTFKIDQELKNILRNTLWRYKYDSEDLEGNEWVFEKENGLVCTTCPQNATKNTQD